MKQRCEEPVLTRILREDAKRVCSPKRMERFWMSFEQKLDEQQAKKENKPPPRPKNIAIIRMLTVCICVAVVICAGAALYRIFSQILPGTASVIIIEEAPPLAQTPAEASHTVSLLATGCLTAVLAVFLYLAAIRIRRKRLIRRVVHKAIRSSQEWEQGKLIH